MKDRIKKLRKELDLTQQKFADRIGVKQNTVAQYEMGRNVPIDTVISLICREFNVSENWLRTGQGEMFEEIPKEDMYSKAAFSLLKDDDPLGIEGLILYYSLSSQLKKAAEDKILELADKIRIHRAKKEE